MPAAPTRAAPPDTLLDVLKRRIGRDGPISVADYMDACLTHPEYGYYATRDPFGAEGDFTTAPEISQVFGELIGAWCAVVWRQLASPTPLRLVELGPGRGTLMADALRAARLMPGFAAALDVHLVETSPALRKAQAETLKGNGAEPRWHDRLEDVPAGPSILVANEFLDALPVRQFERRGGAWFERCISLSKQGGLEFVLASGPLRDTGLLPRALRESARDGDTAEVRPGADAVVKTIAGRAQHHPMAALFIDYGHELSAPGETLQAVRAHDFADPLAAPGQADLTAHVDFARLGETARQHGLRVHGPMAQGDFLTALGLMERSERLMERAREDSREAIASGVRRLADPARMGALFKVMALSGAGLAPPPFPAQPIETGA